MTNEVKLLVIDEDASHAKELLSRIGNIFGQQLFIHPNEVRREIARLEPNLVVLWEPKDDTGLQLLNYIVNELPNTLVIFLTESQDPIKTRDINRTGAFDVLFMPDEITALADVLNRAFKALQVQQKVKAEVSAGFTWGRGEVISFYSGKGGSGRSLVVGTLAQTLQLDSNSSVLLVDLNLQYGGVEIYLDVSNDRSLYDLTPVLNELNDNHIRNVTAIEPRSHMEVLLSPRDAELAEQITEEHVQRLLRAARLYYDYILVDLPTEMNQISFSALEEADRIFYVMTPDVPAIRALGQVLDLFNRLNVDTTNRFELILNRISRETELKAKDVTQHFKYPITVELREDTKRVQQSINKGVPLRTGIKERKVTALMKDIQKLAKILLEQHSRRSAS